MMIVVQPLLADAVVDGMALLSVGLVGYLFMLRFREGRERRKSQRARERDRQNHWGHL
jgi:hypothetical protein